MTPRLSALFAFSITLAACPLVLKVIRFRIIDLPNDRSSHHEATPRGGGLAIAIGALVALAVSPDLSVLRAPLILAAAALGLLGLIDDVRRLPALWRFAAQIVVAVATVPLLLRDLTGSVAWQILFTFGVTLWLVSYVNAFNFMDGINGIAVVQAIVAGGAWWVLGTAGDVPALAAGGLVIAACAAAFAPFNYPRARMFLGDIGSYFLGGWLAVLVVLGLRSGLPTEAVVAPVAVALVDTMSTIVRRVRLGEQWYEPHREHVYQRLVASGWSHTVTTGFVAIVIVACSAAGFATTIGTPTRFVADIMLVAALVGYLASPAIAAREWSHKPASAG